MTTDEIIKALKAILEQNNSQQRPNAATHKAVKDAITHIRKLETRLLSAVDQ